MAVNKVNKKASLMVQKIDYKLLALEVSRRLGRPITYGRVYNVYNGLAASHPVTDAIKHVLEDYGISTKP